MSLQRPTVVPEFTDSYEYAKIRNEFTLYNNPNATPSFTEQELQKFKDGSDPDRYPNENWYERVFNKDFAPLQQHNVNISGGQENMRFFVTLGYLDQKGLNDAVRFKRYNVRSNLDVKVAKHTEASIDINAVSSINDPNHNINVYETWRNLPTFPAAYSNGYIALAPGGYAQPYASINSQAINQARTSKADIRLDVKQEIPWIKGLSVGGLFMYGQNHYYQKSGGADKVDIYSLNTDGTFTLQPKSSPTLTIIKNHSEFSEKQARINYENTFGNHSISFLGMFLENQSFSSNGNVSAWGFDNDALVQINAASENNATGFDFSTGRQSYVGRLNYAFNQKYLIEGNIRRDGTENFHPDKRWGVFGSGSAAWIISEENFFKNNIKFVQFLKLRGSYGTLGNDLINGGRFPYYSKFQSYVSPNWIATKDNLGDYVFDGTYTKGLYPGAIANPGVTWEKSTKTDIGIDVNFLSSMNFSFDYFKEIRSGILATRSESVPQTFGAILPMENIGEVNNKGFEFSLGYNKFFNSDLQVFANGNLTITNNEIIFMDEAKNISEYLKREGRPVDAYYGYQAIGIFQDYDEINNYAKQQLAGANYKTKPGDIKYMDVNGDKVVNSADRTFLGDGSVPNIIYGITSGFVYKNFDFSFLVQGAGGVQVAPQRQVVYPLFNNGNIPQFWADNYWSENNKDAKYSSININEHNFPSSAITSTFVYDASYIRLKNVEIGYKLPKSLLSKARINNVRFYIGGTNLLTFTDIPQVDPEITNGGGNVYPNQITLNFGVNIDF